MTPEDTAFTIAWWDRLLGDDARMQRWLQKLWATEYSGWKDNYDAAVRWGGDNLAVMNVFLKTGDEEMKHAELLEGVLRGRGWWHAPEGPPQAESAYWNAMEAAIDSLETCAAVFHYGEHLAAERFQVLYDHPDTPDDIRAFLAIALPEERHHARVFFKMTDLPARTKVFAAHEAAVAALKGQ